MNVVTGFESVIRRPIILLVPIVIQVLFSFILGFGLLLGIDLDPFLSFSIGDLSGDDITVRAVLPIVMPLIEDMQHSLTFLPSSGNMNFFSTVIFLFITQMFLSFAIGVYLGTIKEEISFENNQNQSFIEMGKKYFKRVFLFQIVLNLFLFFTLYLLFIFWPLAIFFFILYFFYSLVPYIIVLENKSLAEAVHDSPKYFKTYFLRFLPLALGALVTTFIFSLILIYMDESTKYYALMVGYTFIGSGFIAAFMNLFNQLITEEKSFQMEVVKKREPLWKRFIIVLFILGLPLFGVKFAKGEHVVLFAAPSNDAYTNGLAFQSSWSEAHYGSEFSVTTYGFEELDAYQLMLPHFNIDSGKKHFSGKGKVTWKADQEQVRKVGTRTTYWGEEVVLDSEFIFRLKSIDYDGKEYFSSANQGFAKLLKQSQFDEPTNMEVYLMNDGEDVFIYQYKERFDPYLIQRFDENFSYFIPQTSKYNPNDFKYFWYSKNPITKDRLLDFLHAKNRELVYIGGGPEHYSFEYILATFLQEADVDALMLFEEEARHLEIETNISDKSEEDWDRILNELYGDIDLTTLISYINLTNMHDGYERSDWNEEEFTEYQLTVPFPNGDILLNCVREDGVLVKLEIELPEGM